MSKKINVLKKKRKAENKTMPVIFCSRRFYQRCVKLVTYEPYSVLKWHMNPTQYSHKIGNKLILIINFTHLAIFIIDWEFIFCNNINSLCVKLNRPWNYYNNIVHIRSKQQNNVGTIQIRTIIVNFRMRIRLYEGMS